MKLLVTCILLCVQLTTQAQFFKENSSFQTPLRDSRSANWIDINSDGYLDIFISNGKSGGQNNEAYLNNGAGIFYRDSTSAIATDSSSSVGAVWANVDNAYGLELFVANWYLQKNLFYTSNQNSNYVPLVLKDPVLASRNSESGAFADVNGDNWLDLIVANSATGSRNEFYKNLGDGNFEYQQTHPVSQVGANGRGVSFADINNDGHLDVFIAAEGFGNCELYIGDGQNLIKINDNPLTTQVNNAMGSCWGDYDNDGDLDVFITTLVGPNLLYRNQGNLNFKLMGSEVIPQIYINSFSANWGDIDNDGDLDLVVGNAFVTGQKVKNHLFINNGDSTFSQNTSDTVALTKGWTFGTAFGDYDQDGDLDLLFANCFDAAQKNQLFENLSSQNLYNWVVLNCQGTISNKSAVGARIKLVTSINGEKHNQIREISAPSSYCGQNMFPVHFGLGIASNIDSVIVYWPSGLVEFYNDISTNNYHNIEEGMGFSLSSRDKNYYQDILRVFPNPIDNSFSIMFSNSIPVNASLSLFSLSGKQIKSLVSRKVAPNEVIDIVLGDGLKPGTYLLIGEINQTSVSQKIVIQ